MRAQWSTSASGSTAREYILTGGGRIVAGRMCGPYMLVWTGDALFLGAFWLTWQAAQYAELGDYLIRIGLSWLFLTFLSFLAFSAIVASLSTFFLSDDLRRDPYPLYEQVRSSSPLLHEPQSDMWLVFDYESVKLRFTDDALEAIAELAITRKIGARGLRMIIEDLMLDLMYTLPGQKKVRECVITREVVQSKEKPITLIEKAG